MVEWWLVEKSMEELKAKITNFKEKSNYVHIKLIGER